MLSNKNIIPVLRFLGTKELMDLKLVNYRFNEIINSSQDLLDKIKTNPGEKTSRAAVQSCLKLRKSQPIKLKFNKIDAENVCGFKRRVLIKILKQMTKPVQSLRIVNCRSDLYEGEDESDGEQEEVDFKPYLMDLTRLELIAEEDSQSYLFKEIISCVSSNLEDQVQLGTLTLKVSSDRKAVAKWKNSLGQLLDNQTMLTRLELQVIIILDSSKFYIFKSSYLSAD